MRTFTLWSWLFIRRTALRRSGTGLWRGAFVSLASMGCVLPAGASEVEVLHRWTSGGEAKAIDQLKSIVKAKGVTWKDFAVEGGAASNAALKVRAEAKNFVGAAQMAPPIMRTWGKRGVLGNLDEVAIRGGWDKILSGSVRDMVRYEGRYVAVPLNVHRENWLWINTDVLKKAGASIPVTLDEFFETAEKIKQAGMIPIARGGQPWQDTIMFESIVLGVGGPAFYKKAIVEQDRAALGSATMLKVFETLARIRSYIDKYAEGRNWNTATSMIIHGKAGMQFMGDWAKADFAAKGKQVDRDFVCVPAPGTQGAFIFTIDTLAMFDLNGPGQQEAQAVLAETVMSPEFQSVFNLNKGSIPARLNVSRDKFDNCGLKSMDDFDAASKNSALVPSPTMAASPEKVAVFQSVAFLFMNTKIEPRTAMATLLEKLDAEALERSKAECQGTACAGKDQKNRPSPTR